MFLTLFVQGSSPVQEIVSVVTSTSIVTPAKANEVTTSKSSPITPVQTVEVLTTQALPTTAAKAVEVSTTQESPTTTKIVSTTAGEEDEDEDEVS